MFGLTKLTDKFSKTFPKPLPVVSSSDREAFELSALVISEDLVSLFVTPPISMAAPVLRVTAKAWMGISDPAAVSSLIRRRHVEMIHVRSSLAAGSLNKRLFRFAQS